MISKRKRKARKAMNTVHERRTAETETRANLSPLPRTTRMMMTMVSSWSRTGMAREDKTGRDNNSKATVTPMMASPLPELASEAAEVVEVAEVDSSRTLDVQLLLKKIEKNLHAY